MGGCYQVDDLRENRIFAHFIGDHQERAGLIDGAADQFVAGFLFHRHRFAGEHGFVHRTAALSDRAVDRNLFTRSHAEEIALVNVLQRDLLFYTVAHDAGRGGSERHELANSPARSSTGS